MDPLNLFELEQAARERLPRDAYDYYAGGAADGITLRENRAAFDRLRLHYRVLRDISRRDLSTTVLGVPLSLPVIVAPTAFHRMAHPDGELATARAAGTAGTAMVLSTLSTTGMEEVLQAATGPVWFQLYVYRDREATRALVQRAERAGCTAIVLTADAQVWGRREQDVRNRFRLPEGLAIENLTASGKGELPREAADSGLAVYATSLFDPALSWQDLDWLCSTTPLPVLVKGVVRGDDARRTIDHGAAGVVVSNHGGRQLDGAPATIEVLPRIAESLGGAGEILLDGGVRRGTDVIKALALGARAVAVGRPVLWGLAWAGERGVARVLEMLRAEIDLALGLCGCSSLEELTPELVGRAGEARAWP